MIHTPIPLLTPGELDAVSSLPATIGRQLPLVGLPTVISNRMPATRHGPVESFHDFTLLLSSYSREVIACLGDAFHLIFEGEDGRVDAADEGGEELPSKGFEGRLEGEELPVVVDEDGLVVDRLAADVSK